MSLFRGSPEPGNRLSAGLTDAGALLEISQVLQFHPLKVCLQQLVGRLGQNGAVVFSSLSAQDSDLVVMQVQVPDSQPGAFEQTQPGSV